MTIDSFLMEMPVCSSRAVDKSRVVLPLSKSIAARVLVALFWSGGCLDCLEIPDCDDSRELKGALSSLREWQENPEMGPAAFNMGQGATSLRFFMPVVASLQGLIADVDCGEGLRRRPVAVLADALIRMGGDVRWRSEECRPPFLISGRTIVGGEIEMDASVSSQFVSAMMLSAPMWEKGLSVRYSNGRSVSAPYLEMTAEVMRRMGAKVRLDVAGVDVAPGGYLQGSMMEIEADWSAASYFYEWLLARGRGVVEIASLASPEVSLQGDCCCAALMEEVGVITKWHPDGSATLSVDSEKWEAARNNLRGVCWNLDESPDLVPALAVGLCQAGIRFRFEGVAHLRHKETDRMHALVTELGRLGYRLIPGDSTLSWEGERVCSGSEDSDVEILSYGDHRMAMSFGAIRSLHPRMQILNPEVVSKSFAGFWKEISKIDSLS